MKKSFAIIFILLLMYLACGQKINENINENGEISVNDKVEMNNEDCITMNFHYLITYNILSTPKVRDIEVFLDDKAFSEENLKVLFNFLSEKYPNPNFLIIKVKTSWDQLPLPTDCPPSGASGHPNNEDKFDNYYATFYRKKESEYFKYNPVLKTSEFKTVIIK